MTHMIRPYIPRNDLSEIEKAVGFKEGSNPQPEKPIVEPISSQDTEVQSSVGAWEISGVQYRGIIYEADLSKTLLPPMTQDQLAKYTIEAKKRGEFHGADYPLHYAIFSALHRAKGNPSTEEARNFLEKQSKANWLTTLTRVKYNPVAPDEIIHNFGLPEQYQTDTDFLGPDEWVKSSSRIKDFEALLGTNDSVTQINDVINWVTGKNAYIWKSYNSSRTQNATERVARFNAGSDGAVLDCVWYPTGAYASLGVRFRKKKLRIRDNFSLYPNSLFP